MSEVYATRRVGAAAVLVTIAALVVLAIRLLTGEAEPWAAGDDAPVPAVELGGPLAAGEFVVSTRQGAWHGSFDEVVIDPLTSLEVQPGGALPAERTAAEGDPEPDPEPTPEPEPEPEAQPAPQPPPAVAGREEGALLPTLDADTIADVATRTGVPPRALMAYAGAARVLEDERPGCGVTWSTLAGVGWVESRHGNYGGAQLRADGYPTEPIIGIPLDGGPNVRAIRDTDGGRLDGDTTWDRAVGPMQFIPSTWARWGADGNGDGVSDPQHIDDAALAAARYLCASGGDLTQGNGWWRAVLTYNRSEQYAHHVLDAANTYARRSHG